jgi:ABC-2 type transport system permease protein
MGDDDLDLFHAGQYRGMTTDVAPGLSRATYLVLLAAAVIASGIGLLVCNVDVGQWPRMSPGQRAGFDPMADSFTGFAVAQLLFAAIGVLTVTGEYSSGLIRTTFTAVPARRAVLAAKAAVVGLITAATGRRGACHPPAGRLTRPTSPTPG